MAFGDKLRLSGAIWLENSNFNACRNYVFGAVDNIPDAWRKTVSSGTFQVNLAAGYSDDRSVRIFSQPASAGGFNSFRSDSSQPGSFPQLAELSGLTTYIRLRFRYRRNVANQSVTPTLWIYNADESNTPLSVALPVLSAVTFTATGWGIYDQVVQVTANKTQLGFYPDHIQLDFIIGGSTTALTLHIDDVRLGFPLSDEVNTLGYDLFTSNTPYRGTSLSMNYGGRFVVGTNGRMRYRDGTGGATRARFHVAFPALTQADRKTLECGRRLNAGEYSHNAAFTGAAHPYPSPLMNACPILVETFAADVAGAQSSGKLRESFYAWIVDMSDPEPQTPDNRTITVVTFEEAG